MRWDSALWVIVLAAANGLLYAASHGATLPAVTRLIYPLLAWGLYGYLGSFLVRILYRAEAPVPRILNILGYAQAPGALGVLLTTAFSANPGSASMSILRIFVSAVALILLCVSVIAEIIAFRQAGTITTLQAVIVFAVCFVILLLIQSAITPLIPSA